MIEAGSSGGAHHRLQGGVPKPVVPLRADNTVEIRIERLGTLRNRVVANAAEGTADR